MVSKAVVSKDRIEAAFAKFDSELRHQPQWLGWEEKLAYRYAIQVGEKLYPPKKILSLATGIPVVDFHGGAPTNKALGQHGFIVVELARGATKPELQFTLGAIYDRRTEIHGPFGGSFRSGITPSSSYPAIFLFTGDSGEQYGYADREEEGVYLYTGEGQRGPMTLTRGNLAIAEHAKTGRALHLFKSQGKSQGYAYVGEFSCADILERTQPDKTGAARKALVFRLVPVEIPGGVIEAQAEDDPGLPTSLEAARAAALEACTSGGGEPGQSAPRKLYQRSRKVAHYVLMRANGACESCEKPAPFMKKDGTPYLEPHHVNRLSDGGLDHPRYVGAVCPSCHREIHSGVDGTAINDRLKVKLAAREA